MKKWKNHFVYINIEFVTAVRCWKTLKMFEKCLNLIFCIWLWKSCRNPFENWVGTSFYPEWDDVTSRPLSCPGMPQSVFWPGVFASMPPLPVASSFIRYILLTAMKKTLLHIHQTTVKRGGLRKRRSSRLAPATGLHWFHQHIGLVSGVFLLFSYYSSVVMKKTPEFLYKVDKKISSCAVIFQQNIPLFTFFAPCASLMTKRRIFTRSFGNVAQLDNPVTQQKSPVIFNASPIHLRENEGWII